MKKINNKIEENVPFEAYVTKKPLAEYSKFKAIFTLLFTKKTFKPTAKFIASIWSNFFIIQQEQKVGLTKIPLVNVDHELDQKITFTPKKVYIYLDFVSFFLRIFSMFIKTLPKEVALKLCAEYASFLTKLYEDAGSIYRYTLTTTKRPFYLGNFHFIIIHLFDPHFLCVPSLHVAIVAGSWAFVKKAFQNSEVNIPKEEKKRILNEVFEGARAITETVLYVKQHSINCVAGALYFLTADNDIDFFTSQMTKEFLDALFANQTDIQEADKLSIKEYIQNLYMKLTESNQKSKVWQQPLYDFLDEYKGHS